MKYFIVIFLILFGHGCKKEQVRPVINPEIRVEELPVQESWNSTIIFTDSGITKAILRAGHIRVYDHARETLLDDGIEVDFFDDDEVITTNLTSKRGRVDDSTSDIWAIDSVVVISNDGTTITTDELMWRNSDSRILSDKFVTIVSPKEKIQGYGFESDQGLKNYVIYNITFVTHPDSL